MPTPLRVLMLEDCESDAALILHELRQAGFDLTWQRVEDEPGFLTHLEPRPDLICADYSMPQFDVPRALALLAERGLDIPFVIVSGSVGEELAVAAMRQGAADYLLKDRLARLGPAVRQALEQKRLRDEKRQLEQALKTYLAMLAHELRNPLAPLLTSLEVVRQPAADARTRQLALDAMARSVRQLTRLVDDLLEATRISQGRIQLRTERVDVARLARTAAEDRRRLIEQAGLRLTVATPETPLWVTGDETRLAQCLHNLLDNATRFTDPGGTICLSAVVEEGQVVVAVQDTGIGMEPAVLAALFRPFSQADRSLDRRRGGLGLGLSIVKALVEGHRGTVAAASDGPGGGATFTVRLPLEPEPPALTALPSEAKAAPYKVKVLVVEDVRDTADSLKLLLELRGQEVRVAYTGPEGVAQATAWGPDLVLCDIGLPGLDGFGVAAALRQHPRTARVRLIAVTGYGSDEDRRRAQEAGFDQLLRKPVEPADLEGVLTPGHRSPPPETRTPGSAP
jgi:signal transduction histidine kinase/ActR/RegA family two-component response regulator